jgi:hypothetical protein
LEIYLFPPTDSTGETLACAQHAATGMPVGQAFLPVLLRYFVALEPVLAALKAFAVAKLSLAGLGKQRAA